MRKAVGQTEAAELLVGMSAGTFRNWMKRSCKRLKLEDRKLLPYSFRRGGITASVTNGVPVSTVIFRARWHSPKVALAYIQ